MSTTTYTPPNATSKKVAAIVRAVYKVLWFAVFAAPSFALRIVLIPIVHMVCSPFSCPWLGHAFGILAAFVLSGIFDSVYGLLAGYGIAVFLTGAHTLNESISIVQTAVPGWKD